MSVDQLDQMKRQSRINNHVKKTLSGEVIDLMFREYSTQLYAFVFKSGENYYQVNIPIHQGQELFPLLKKGTSSTIEVTTDPVLFEQILYASDDMLRAENKFGIRITGLVNLQKLQSSLGSFEKGKMSFPQSRDLPQTFVESAQILSKKKAPGNMWSLALDNEDTLLIKYDEADFLPSGSSLSYLKSKSILLHGAFIKSFNSYRLFADSPSGNKSYSDMFMFGQSALVLSKDQFKALSYIPGENGLLSGLKVLKNKDTLDLYFEPENGTLIQNNVKLNQNFDAYFRMSKNQKGSLYGLYAANASKFLKLQPPFIGSNNHYFENKKSFKGPLTGFELQKPGVKNSFKGFVLSDSVYVKVNEIVAINIHEVMTLGKEIEIKGWLRKPIEGEINLKDYSIFSPTEIIIDGKVFKQLIYDINKEF